MNHLLTFEKHGKKSRADELQDLIYNWEQKNSAGAVDIVPPEVRDAWQSELEELLSKEMERKRSNFNEANLTNMATADEMVGSNLDEKTITYEQLYRETDELNKEALQAITLVVKLGDNSSEEKLQKISDIIEQHGVQIDELSEIPRTDS